MKINLTILLSCLILSTVQLLPPVCASFSCLFFWLFYSSLSSCLSLSCLYLVLSCPILYYLALYLHCSLIFCSAFVIHHAVFLIYPLSHPLSYPPLLSTQHLFSALGGLFLAQWVFGPDWMHSIISSGPHYYLHIAIFFFS